MFKSRCGISRGSGEGNYHRPVESLVGIPVTSKKFRCSRVITRVTGRTFVLFVRLGQAWPNCGGGRFHDKKLSQSSHDLEVRYRHVATVYILFTGTFFQIGPDREIG